MPLGSGPGSGGHCPNSLFRQMLPPAKWGLTCGCRWAPWLSPQMRWREEQGFLSCSRLPLVSDNPKRMSTMLASIEVFSERENHRGQVRNGTIHF